MRRGVPLFPTLDAARANGVDCLFPVAYLRDPAAPQGSAVAPFIDYCRRNRIPTVFSNTMLVEQRGGLASVEIDSAEGMRLGAEMVLRVLRGEKPATMPVQQPSLFIVALNRAAARSMGISFPESALIRATRVVG